MTVWLARRWSGLQRAAGLAWVAICLASVSGQAFAARVAVVLSEDAALYQEAYQVIHAHLEADDLQVSRMYAGGVTAAALNDARLVVAVGVRAAEALAAFPNRPPVLALLVPRAWYLKTGRARLTEGGRYSAAAIYIDQPFERQAALIRLAFPDARRVGVVLSVEQDGVLGELGAALRAQHLELKHAPLIEGERLISPLETVLSEADVLLALPDPLVFNRNTAQSLFLTSYRYHVPVLGYSRSLSRAGALLSLYSSPAQIGRQAAEWVGHALTTVPATLPKSAHPAYFSISINDQVARSLGFRLPSEAELEKRLGGGR